MIGNFEDLHDIDQSVEYTRSYDVRYVAEIRHLGLGTYRILKDTDQWILDNKIEAQFKKWDEQWAKAVYKNRSQASREANLNLAEERTREAKEKLKAVEDLLLHTLEIDDTIDWNTLKDTREFKIPNPKNLLEKELGEVSMPESPSYKAMPLEPNANDFQLKLSFFDKFVKSKALKKQSISEAAYNEAMLSWKELVRQTENYNLSLDEKFNQLLCEMERQKDEIKKKYDLLERKWELEKREYLRKQEEHNKKVDDLKQLYLRNDANAVIEYCELVLNNSEYPDEFPKNFDLEYNQDNRLLIIEYALPAPDNFPKLSEVKYIAAKGSIYFFV